MRGDIVNILSIIAKLIISSFALGYLVEKTKEGDPAAGIAGFLIVIFFVWFFHLPKKENQKK